MQQSAWFIRETKWWIPHHNVVHSTVQGPMANGEDELKIADIYHNGFLDFDKLSI